MGGKRAKISTYCFCYIYFEMNHLLHALESIIEKGT